jgi:hypothetical protein
MLIFDQRQRRNAGAELLARFGSARQTGPARPDVGAGRARAPFFRSRSRCPDGAHSTDAPGDDEPAILASSGLRRSAEQLPQRPREVP